MGTVRGRWGGHGGGGDYLQGEVERIGLALHVPAEQCYAGSSVRLQRAALLSGGGGGKGGGRVWLTGGRHTAGGRRGSAWEAQREAERAGRVARVRRGIVM